MFVFVRSAWQALMQAHDSVAGQEEPEENLTQYIGETVKLVRLVKARDTPLVRRHLTLPCFIAVYTQHVFVCFYTAETHTSCYTILKPKLVLYVTPVQWKS